ncbi:hypothetical protein C8R43DRAFT_991126 [Mycena crocata]|nr:hypothetical protein C8R43DRAFT_991126 [Mycena crocata]
MEAKFKTPTCIRCKIRKIRCDGLSSCSTCVTTKVACEYEGDPTSGSELRKGAACLACRRKKKKCDGQLPCRTCLSGRKKIPCEYPDGVVTALPQEGIHRNGTKSDAQDSSPEIIIPTFPYPAADGGSTGSESSPGSSGNFITPPGPHTPPDYDVDVAQILSPSPFTRMDLPTSAESDLIISQAGNYMAGNYMTFTELEQARNLFLEDAEKRGASATDHPMPVDPDASNTQPPSTDDDSPYVTDLHSPSPFVNIDEADHPPEEHHDTLSDIQNLFLAHRFQIGFSVSERALAALTSTSPTCGDPFLHPVVRHAAQLVGYMLARHLQGNTWLCLPGQSPSEAEQTKWVLKALQVPPSPNAVFETPAGPCTATAISATPLARLQTATLLSVYFFNKSDIVRARELLAAADRMIRTHELDVRILQRLRAARVNAPPQNEMNLNSKQSKEGFHLTPPTPEAEALAVISQLVYLDLSFTLIFKIPSVVDQRLHDNFKSIIRLPNPDAELNFVRAKCAFLLVEAETLAEEWYHSKPTAAEATAWQQRYWEVMEALVAHRAFLAHTLTRIAFCPELRILGLSFKVCTVLVLTALTVLFSLFSRDEPELLHKKHNAIGEIISITSTFTAEDCEYLDPLLSACWTAIIGSLDACIALGPDVIAQSMVDIPAMAEIIRDRNQALQRVVPFAMDV